MNAGCLRGVADHKPQAVRDLPVLPDCLDHSPLDAGLGILASLPPHLTLSLKQWDKGATVSAQVNPGSGILTTGEPHKPSGWRLR